MGCGCNKGTAASTANRGAVKSAAPTIGSTLWEVVDGPDATAKVKHRTRDEHKADEMVAKNAGWRKRRAGQR